MLEDIRFAFRQLLKNLGFTAIAMFALALGIGANTAIFSVVNAVLLRPLPYPDSDKLIVVRERSHNFDRGSVAYMNWLDWHAGQRSFSELVLARRENFNFSKGSRIRAPERVRGRRASSGLISTLGLKVKIGRAPTSAGDVGGAPNAVLLSESLWRKQFCRCPP